MDEEHLKNLVDRYGTSKNIFIDLFLRIDRKRLKREIDFGRWQTK